MYLHGVQASPVSTTHFSDKKHLSIATRAQHSQQLKVLGAHLPLLRTWGVELQQPRTRNVELERLQKPRSPKHLTSHNLHYLLVFPPPPLNGRHSSVISHGDPASSRRCSLHRSGPRSWWYDTIYIVVVHVPLTTPRKDGVH